MLPVCCYIFFPPAHLELIYFGGIIKNYIVVCTPAALASAIASVYVPYYFKVIVKIHLRDDWF